MLVALDPRGTRTTHVYTAAHVQFRNLRAHDDALRYVNGRAAPDAHFVAGLSLETRRAVGTNLDLFRERVVQAQMRLQSVAKAVGLDPTEHRIGLKVRSARGKSRARRSRARRRACSTLFIAAASRIWSARCRRCSTATARRRASCAAS